AGVDLLEPVELAVLAVDQLGPVELGLAQLPAEAGRVGEVLGVRSAVDQQLLGHAASQHAGTSDPLDFTDGDPGTVFAGPAARGHATGACADGEEIEVELGHRRTLENRTRLGKPPWSSASGQANVCSRNAEGHRRSAADHPGDGPVSADRARADDRCA